GRRLARERRRRSRPWARDRAVHRRTPRWLDPRGGPAAERLPHRSRPARLAQLVPGAESRPSSRASLITFRTYSITLWKDADGTPSRGRAVLARAVPARAAAVAGRLRPGASSAPGVPQA